MLCPYFLTLLAYDLWQPQRHVWIILTLQGRHILQWETSKLQASTQGKTSFEKKKNLSSLNILELLEKISQFQSFLDQSEPQAKKKNHFKENLCCCWLLAIGCYRLSRPVEQQSPKIFWKTRGTKCQTCCYEQASKRWERQRWRMKRWRVSMGKECHRVYFEALKKRTVRPKLKIKHKY